MCARDLPGAAATTADKDGSAFVRVGRAVDWRSLTPRGRYSPRPAEMMRAHNTTRGYALRLPLQLAAAPLGQISPWTTAIIKQAERAREAPPQWIIHIYIYTHTHA